LRGSLKRVPVEKTTMHSTPKFTLATRRLEGELSGSWCILSKRVSDLPTTTPSYPASPKFARNQEAGT